MTKRSIKFAAFASLMLAALPVIAKPTIIVTGERAGSDIVLGLDFVADKQPVTVVMVEIKLRPGAKADAMKLGNCMRGLAKSHTGGCNVKSNGNLAFIAYGAAANDPLPSGPIGTVTVPADMLVLDESGQVAFDFVEFTLPDATTIEGDALSHIGATSSRK